MSEVVLQGNDLSRSFGEGATYTCALDHVDIEFRRGQFALLMGPSGSGKSTLLAVLSGLLRPQEGRVVALGKDLWAMSDRGREKFRLAQVGFIFQQDNLLPSLTVRQQLEMLLRWGQGLRLKQAREIVEQTLEGLGIGNKADLRPLQLSGGEKQRASIGRALLKRPTLCFADEPTSALDWKHGRSVIQLLRDQARENGATIVAVTHDPRLLPFADVVYHLEDGRLTQVEQASAPSSPAS